VVAYLRPGCECDVAALTRDVGEACASCRSIEDLSARMADVADRHGLRVELDMTDPVPADPVERLVSFGFVPRTN
jgi:hypothetical protein